MLLAVQLLLIFIFGFVQADIQKFSVAPVDTKVLEGQTVVLPCKVDNQAGQVQWSKDQLLFGYNRSIPGHPRYSMVDESEGPGIHNIVIVNVTEQDEGDYECQVSPADGHQPLVAKAHLTVLLPATEIEIKGYENNSKVSTEFSSSLDLTCEVRGGKPAPEVRWYRNEVKIREDSTQISSNTHDGENGRQTMSSVLHLEPIPDDNGAVYTCESQRLVLDDVVFETPVLSSQIQLDVLSPPGRPMIEGYQADRVVRKSDMMKLRCISRGGNPLAQVVWLKNGVVVDHSYVSTKWESINDMNHEADPTDNGAKYTCQVSSTASKEPYESSFQLSVLYAPSKVTIDAPDKAKAGDALTLTCTTAASNPASDVTWAVDGGIITSSNTVTEDSKGGWVTTSKLSVNITEQDLKEKLVSCYATNRVLGETITTIACIDILYAPDPPAIIGYSDGTFIKVGNVQRITCVSQRGNPLPTLKWFKNDKEIEKASENVEGNMISSQITVLATESDNGARYRCESSSPALAEPLVTDVELKVYFPPAHVKIKMKPKKPKAGQKVTLTCESASSNPSASITWWRDGAELSESSGSTSESVHGGNSTKSTLILNASYEDDGSTITCRATNQAVQQSVHDAFALKLLFKPVFTETDQTVWTVNEGENFESGLTVKANPPEVTYTWMKDNQTVFLEGPSLNMTAVSRSDAGRYVCYAKNEVGTSQKTIILKVSFAAVIVKDEPEPVYVVAEPDGDAQLECTAVGYPLSEDAIRWTREGFDMSDRTKKASVSTEEDDQSLRRTSTLTVMNVKKDDSGEFSCIADNKIGESDSYKIILLVKYAPKIKDQDEYSIISSNRNVNTKLRCKATGIPEVEFKWSYEGGPIGDNEHTNLSKKRVDHVTWESTLTINDVGRKDFGLYECVARNPLGFDTVKIAMEADSAPDPPALVRVLNATYDALLLSWVPGFDGGHEQMFRIRYKPINSQFFKYVDVYPANITSIWLTDLEMNITYDLAMMSINIVGHSPYTTDVLKARTLGPSEKKFLEDSADGRNFRHIDNEMLRLLISSASIMFLLLLLFNICLLYAFCRRRSRKRKLQHSYGEEEISSTRSSDEWTTSFELTSSDRSETKASSTSETTESALRISYSSTTDTTNWETNGYTAEESTITEPVETASASSEPTSFYDPSISRLVSFV